MTADAITDKVVTITPATVGRDNQGRFIKGHASTGGRPRRATELSFLKKLRDTVDDEAWQQIVNAAVNAAIAGDAKARDWLSGYLLGPPTGSRLVKLAVAELIGITKVTDRLIDMEIKSTKNPLHQLVMAKISERIGFDRIDGEEA